MVTGHTSLKFPPISVTSSAVLTEYMTPPQWLLLACFIDLSVKYEFKFVVKQEFIRINFKCKEGILKIKFGDLFIILKFFIIMNTKFILFSNLEEIH